MKLEEKHRKGRKRQLKRVNKKCVTGKIGSNQPGGRNRKRPGNFQIKLGFYVDYFGDTSRSINPLHKWRLNLNNNTWYILSLTFMFQDKGIFT